MSTQDQDQRLMREKEALLLEKLSEAASRHAKVLDTNPKTLVGRVKPDLSLIPPVAKLHMADAFMDGAAKYGPFNWRDKAVSIRTYIAAAGRHLDQYLDGEEVADDSKVHHLGHVMACCAIILDATSVGNAADDRPLPGKAGEIVELIRKRRADAESKS